MLFKAEMHSVNNFPTEDGFYVVIENADGYIESSRDVIEFNVGYGWNTHKRKDGTVDTKCRIPWETTKRKIYWLGEEIIDAK